MTLDLNHDEARYLRLKVRMEVENLELAGRPSPQLVFLKALLAKLTKEPK